MCIRITLCAQSHLRVGRSNQRTDCVQLLCLRPREHLASESLLRSEVCSRNMSFAHLAFTPMSPQSPHYSSPPPVARMYLRIRVLTDCSSSHRPLHPPPTPSFDLKDLVEQHNTPWRTSLPPPLSAFPSHPQSYTPSSPTSLGLHGPSVHGDRHSAVACAFYTLPDGAKLGE